MTSLAAIGRSISSFGFSGAGFLTCYHLGVAECLLKNGLLLPKGALPLDHRTPILTGVSGGALVATAVSLGVSPEDAMRATLAIAAQTRQAGGFLDHLKPGFSLIDQVEQTITVLVRDVDEECALRRIDFGRLLHIGLTDSRAFPRFRRNPDAYLYVDHYDSLEEVLSACILSSYIPGLTGPIMANTTMQRHGAVKRANKILLKMLDKGSIKTTYGIPVKRPENSWMNSKSHNGVVTYDDTEDFHNSIMFWDGGLVNVFPVINMDTCIVTPFTGFFTNPTISPSSSSKIPHGVVELSSSFRRPTLCLENLRTIRYIAFSSESLALETWFEQGYNDASTFLNRHNVNPYFSTTQQHLVKGFDSREDNLGPQPTQSMI